MEPVDADAQLQTVLDLASGFWRARVLFGAVELDLFTQLAKGAATKEEIQDSVDLHPSVAPDFLDSLVSLGLLHREGDRYSNAAATDRYLDKAKDAYVGGILSFMSYALYPAWGRLTGLLRSGSPQAGEDDFGEWYKDLDQARGFMNAMDSASAPVREALVRRFDWSAYQTFTDLGGARGNLAGHLVKAHPHLQGITFDMPAIKPLFDERIAELGVTDKVTFQEGDFRTDPLPHTDVLIFGHVLHDWDVQTRVLLVKRAFDALRPGGALLIYEQLLDDDRLGPTRSLLMSLNMRLVRNGGSGYTAAESRIWLREAGFTEVSVEDLTATERLIVARKK